MKDYKIKEALCNLKQSVDHAKKQMTDMTEKFEILIECLQQKEDAEREEEKTA